MVCNTNKTDDVKSLPIKIHICFLYNPLDRVNISNGEYIIQENVDVQ